MRGGKGRKAIGSIRCVGRNELGWWRELVLQALQHELA